MNRGSAAKERRKAEIRGSREERELRARGGGRNYTPEWVWVLLGAMVLLGGSAAILIAIQAVAK